MSLRIQYERFEQDLDLNIEDYSNSYQITTERVEQAKGDVIIMHPGPVNYVEISENAYQSDSSVIRHQVSNSVAIRMAVLSRFLSS
jgi:aspartate carbamoyltransferase catalytic subunit